MKRRRNPPTPMQRAVEQLLAEGVKPPMSLVVALSRDDDDSELGKASAQAMMALAHAMPHMDRRTFDALVDLVAMELLGQVERETRYRSSFMTTIHAVMATLNVIARGYGVEILFDDTGRDVLIYINAGDTYAATFAYDVGLRRWLWTSYGDFVERSEMSGRYTFQ